MMGSNEFLNKISQRKILSILLFFGVWQLASWGYSPIILPSPFQVASGFKELFSDTAFYRDLGVTFGRGLFGYVLSMALGVAMSTLFYLNRKVKEIVYPYVSVLHSIPRISWILLAMIWFPFNSVLVVFTLVITLLPTVVINTYQGYEDIDTELLDMARVFKVGKKRILRHIYIPSIATHIISSAKISMGIMWKTVIMIELLTVQTGLGARMGYLRTALATEQIIAITVLIVILNAGGQWLLGLFHKRNERWKKSL